MIRYLMFQAAMRIVQLVDSDLATEPVVQYALFVLHNNNGNHKDQLGAVKCLRMFTLCGSSGLLKQKTMAVLSSAHPLNPDIAERTQRWIYYCGSRCRRFRCLLKSREPLLQAVID
ncbi:unnamed protein product [Symbiodinium sp. CCMP2592]|nr:unnamed protein product [Symbiodinium sp. CCMP2592]